MGLGRGDLSGGESMSTSTSTSTSESSLPRRFPLAAQPEIMRAAEKDDQYASFVYDACRDAFRHLFGTRVAVAYQRETKLLGQMLYYVLTTGSGQQTLGEEYCDITQVAGPYGIPPNPARRALFIVYQTAVPYIAERIRPLLPYFKTCCRHLLCVHWKTIKSKAQIPNNRSFPSDSAMCHCC
ncbi:hypothetical protein ACB092_11G002600 [Castanea dentata]